MLLLEVEYSLAISRYSLMVTLVGIEGNFKNSQIAIFKIIVSISAIRSLSQFGVLSTYCLDNSFSFRTVFLKRFKTNSLSSVSLFNFANLILYTSSLALFAFLCL